LGITGLVSPPLLNDCEGPVPISYKETIAFPVMVFRNCPHSTR
jgi:hypothetical protein